MQGSTFAAEKRRGFRLWRKKSRRRTQKSEGSANENGTNDENAEGDDKVGSLMVLIYFFNFCKKFLTNFIFLYSQSVVSDHVEITSDEIVVHVTKVKMVMQRILETVVRQLPMMGFHVAMRKMVGDVAAFSNVISVNNQANRVIMEMAEMLNQKIIMRTLILKIMGKDAVEILDFVHEIDQAKILR